MFWMSHRTPHKGVDDLVLIRASYHLRRRGRHNGGLLGAWSLLVPLLAFMVSGAGSVGAVRADSSYSSPWPACGLPRHGQQLVL